jgi:hypothetical protein
MEGMISAATPQRYGALMALVTRFHSNALVERRHVLEGHDMKTTKSRSCSRIATFMSILLAVVLVATGCAPTQDQKPTQDQLLGRVMSTDSNSVQIVRREIRWFSADVWNLTSSTGYLTPLTRSQLAGSIAGRFETMANIGIAAMPLNEKDLGFDSVDSKEIQAARLMTDVCLACSQTLHGPIASVQDIAGRVSQKGTLTPQDSSYLQNLSLNLKKASDLIGRYVTETESSARTVIVEQVAEVCTQLKGQ